MPANEMLSFQFWIRLFLENFSFAMFILAVIFIIFHKSIKRGRIADSEIVYRWVALFALGFSLIYVAILHFFFPVLSAIAIGWIPSPFQFEVAVADLALGVLAIASFKASYGFRLATVVAATICLWGFAIGHIYQAIVYGNYSMGNIGPWCWMDIIIPFILIICILKLKPGKLIVT